ncbi:hypothetical protein F0A17_02245 [Billgrantia pellis]|uniref:Uncharacterized protein n=1 Tax=Billgrantia pellis TaxID=2606936 RepID=A0A7V7G3C0_9GAMM|nr:hypothetical protein [Halomonas pellis]KAA0014490.1 hypothetical protein F0A17_02245 [Halomonas pellis]
MSLQDSTDTQGKNTDTQESTVDISQRLFSLANAFRVAAVLCVVFGLYLFFEVIQFANVAGWATYEVGFFRLGIAVIVSLFLLLGEKVCRYIDDERHDML